MEYHIEIWRWFGWNVLYSYVLHVWLYWYWFFFWDWFNRERHFLFFQKADRFMCCTWVHQWVYLFEVYFEASMGTLTCVWMIWQGWLKAWPFQLWRLILDGIFYIPMSCEFDCIDIDFWDWFNREDVFFSSKKEDRIMCCVWVCLLRQGSNLC